MRPALAAQLSRALVGCYPRRWRERYGPELLDVFDQHRPGADVLNLAASALTTHLDRAYRAERLPMIPLRRGGIIAAHRRPGHHCARPDGRRGRAGRGGRDRRSARHLFGVAFSPDGRILATSSGEDEILWNVADPARPTQLAVLPGYPVAAGPALFSPDGRTLASAYGSTLALWNLADPARIMRIATLSGQAGDLAAVSFSPNGQLLATVNDNGTVNRWTVADPSAVTRVTSITCNSIGTGSAAFSPDGRTVAGAPTTGDTVFLCPLP